MVKEKVNCMQCKHYYITWERNLPNGCKAYGIKSKLLPSLMVLKSLGEICPVFTKKETKSD